MSLVSGNYFCPVCSEQHRRCFLAEARGFTAGFIRIVCHRCSHHIWLKAGLVEPPRAPMQIDRIAYAGFDPATDPDWHALPTSHILVPRTLDHLPH